jgi:hypothetical protein
LEHKLAPHEVNEEITFLDFGFIFVKSSRLRAFNNPPIDIKVSIMAWADVGSYFLLPVYTAAQMGALIGECQNGTILVLDDINTVTVDGFLPAIDFGAVEVE